MCKHAIRWLKFKGIDMIIIQSMNNHSTDIGDQWMVFMAPDLHHSQQGQPVVILPNMMMVISFGFRQTLTGVSHVVVVVLGGGGGDILLFFLCMCVFFLVQPRCFFYFRGSSFNKGENETSQSAICCRIYLSASVCGWAINCLACCKSDHNIGTYRSTIKNRIN